MGGGRGVMKGRRVSGWREGSDEGKKGEWVEGGE